MTYRFASIENCRLKINGGKLISLKVLKRVLNKEAT